MIASYGWLLFSGGCLWAAVEMLASSFVAWQVEEWGPVVRQARAEVEDDDRRWRFVDVTGRPTLPAGVAMVNEQEQMYRLWSGRTVTAAQYHRIFGARP